jgi:hypothetical protein
MTIQREQGDGYRHDQGEAQCSDQEDPFSHRHSHKVVDHRATPIGAERQLVTERVCTCPLATR